MPGSSSFTRWLAQALGVALLVVACGAGPQASEAPSERPSDDPPEEGVVAAAAEPGVADERFGAALERPELYYGVYASPQTPDRTWFVAEAKRPVHAEQAPEVPPGHLMVGALFGDVAPWPLRTLSETEFEQAVTSDFDPEPLSLRFELDDEGRAVAMIFIAGSFVSEGRLERTGDLPEGWR